MYRFPAPTLIGGRSRAATLTPTAGLLLVTARNGMASSWLMLSK